MFSKAAALVRRTVTTPQPLVYDFSDVSGWQAPDAANGLVTGDASAAPDDIISARREQADVRQAITSAFDAAHPVERRTDLHDRTEKLNLMFDAVLDRGQHAIVHGARGSGKTSLVRVFGDYADQHGAVVVYLACEPTDDFARLISPYLDFVPRSALRGGAKADFLRGRASLGEQFGPRALVSMLADTIDKTVIFIIDEFDRITDAGLQADVATFMKLLADARVPVQIVAVGIAQSVDELISGHLSLRRHLIAIGVTRLSRDGMTDIIDHGEAESGFIFDAGARALIIAIADGSPYHLRLFCQQAAMAALTAKRSEIDEDFARDGIKQALMTWADLNEGDYALFQQLTRRDPATRLQLEQIARLAIRENGLDADTDYAMLGSTAPGGALSKALVADVRETGKMLFRDSLAPQFLLALLAVTGLCASRDGAGEIGNAVCNHEDQDVST